MEAPAGLSLLDQIFVIEDAINIENEQVTVRQGFVHEPIRLLPPTTVQEAVLNGIIHRDWNRSESLDTVG